MNRSTPTAVYPHFDKVQVWLKPPANPNDLEFLRKHCGRGGLYVDNRPAPFGKGYRQRLEFKQPSHAALRWLAQRDDVLVNRVEISLDYIFDSWNDRDEAQEFLHFHRIRRWHSKKQQIWLCRTSKDGNGKGRFNSERVYEIEEATTRYDSGRRSRNGTTAYLENHSRVTGELFCLHLEWRANGLRAVQAAGIKSASDLLDFDHHEFWKKRLILVDVDTERLGRLFRDRAKRSKSRTTAFKSDRGILINMDRRWGHAIKNGVGSLQELLDTHRTDVRVERALRPISNSAWLPPSVRRAERK
jgi:hypothetical protein